MTRFPRLAAALDYAAEAHGNQARKGTEIPYLGHLMGVASLVIDHGGDEDQAIAGLLHDILEDCGAEHEAPIRRAFGDRVADMVLACTDGTPDEAGVKAPWTERKRLYLRHLKTATDETLLVSACDKLHNARAIAADVAAGEDVFARFKGGRDGTLWYYRSLLQIFARRLPGQRSLVIELENAIGRMKAPAAKAAK